MLAPYVHMLLVDSFVVAVLLLLLSLMFYINISINSCVLLVLFLLMDVYPCENFVSSFLCCVFYTAIICSMLFRLAESGWNPRCCVCVYQWGDVLDAQVSPV